MKNIDDLIDYRDNEDDDLKDFDINYDQDSFNDDILKMYEDHKKKVSKPTEIQNIQRPISKYQRNQQDKRDINSEQDNKEVNSISNVNIPELVARLNFLIQKNKVLRTEFCDNPDIFLDLNDFKELFRKIHFVISNKELNALFAYNNPSVNEGFILCKTFFDTHKLNWKEVSVDKIDNEYDVKKINLEFKALQDEVFEVDNFVNIIN